MKQVSAVLLVASSLIFGSGVLISPVTARQGENAFPLTVPLNLNGAYLGEIDIQVLSSGSGRVQKQSLLGYLEGKLDPKKLEQIKAAVAALPQDFAAFSEFETDDVSLAFDQRKLVLDLKVAVSAKQINEISLIDQSGANRARTRSAAAFSSGLNIEAAQSINFSAPDGQDAVQPVALRFRGITNFGGFSGASLFYGARIDSGVDRSLRRENFVLVKDWFDDARRLQIGEFVPFGTGFQRTTRFLGVSLGSNYQEIRPFQNITPGGRRELILEDGSDVDIALNGQVIDTLSLQPGRYTIDDFPFLVGSNDVSFVIRDSFGVEQASSFEFLYEPTLLNRGLAEYGLAVGVNESSAGQRTYSDDVVLSGFYRYGLTDSLTLSAGTQLKNEEWLATFGVGIISKVGLFNINGGLSQLNSELGGALSVNHRYFATPGGKMDIDLQTDFELNSRRFGSPLPRLALQQSRWRLSSNLRIQFYQRFALTLGYTQQNRFVGQSQSAVRASINIPYKRFNFSIGGAYGNTATGQREASFLVSLNLLTGQRWRTRAEYDSINDRYRFDIARNLRGGVDDYGGQLQVSDGQNGSDINADVAWEHPYFSVRVRQDVAMSRGFGTVNQNTTSYSFGTFIGFADGSFAIGRPVRSSFIILDRHPSLAKSEVTMEGPGSRREARLPLFNSVAVPIEQDYTTLRYGVNVAPLPLGYDLGVNDLTFLSGIGTGHKVKVGSDYFLSVMGNLVDDDGDPLALINGVIENRDGSVNLPFFTNRNGRFVISGAAEGSYRAKVRDKTVAEFEVLQDDDNLVELGVLNAKY